MTFLPIVGRELRTASRHGETYWARSSLGGAAVLAGAGFWGYNASAKPEEVARAIFAGISLIGLIYALVAGRRFTADCLSSEKRSGTLGLLFLTDLKGYDIVFGKLAATSFSGFFGLLAVAPVLAVPLLMGGISPGEIFRMVLVLLNTFWFSLAVGMFASALSREAPRAFGANFTLVLLIIAAPATVAGIIALTAYPHSPAREWIEPLLYSCPFYSAWASFDINFPKHDFGFLISVLLLHGLAWLMIFATAAMVPRCWQDRPSGTGISRSWKERFKNWGYGDARIRREYRKRLLDRNAFYWLASRWRIKPALVWTFLVFMVVWWVYVSERSGAYLMYESLFVTALILNSTFKLWVAVETGQRIGEDQTSGAMELLLSTRLSEREILRGQFMALRRQFFWPLVIVILVEIIFTALLIKNPPNHGASCKMLVLGTGAIVMLIIDIVVLFWVAALAALTSKNSNIAIVKTIMRVLILPWVLFAVGVVIGNLYQDRTRGPLVWSYYFDLWFLAGAIVSATLGLNAWNRVRTKFRELATATS